VIAFVPGIELARGFYREAVAPLLAGIPHSAALLGQGSEVLGFDTARSTDHDWGPRCEIFLDDGDPELIRRLDGLLTARLPSTWHGYRTAFPHTHAPETRHRIVITHFEPWVRAKLGFDPLAGVTRADWLAVPTQPLAEFTGGAVFHDGLGVLEPARAALAWYPDDVWRYVLAVQWQRIAQEEAFPGRCAEVGDELGAAVVTARLIRDLMRLWLLMLRRYPPYSKWLGSAFAALPELGDLPDHLRAALAATDHPTRESYLAAAYEQTVRRHNALQLTEPIDPHTRPYYDRPFQVIGAERIVHALLPAPQPPLTGAIDQFVDSTDALGDHTLLRRIIGTPVTDIHCG